MRPVGGSDKNSSSFLLAWEHVFCSEEDSAGTSIAGPTSVREKAALLWLDRPEIEGKAPTSAGMMVLPLNLRPPWWLGLDQRQVAPQKRALIVRAGGMHALAPAVIKPMHVCSVRTIWCDAERRGQRGAEHGEWWCS